MKQGDLVQVHTMDGGFAGRLESATEEGVLLSPMSGYIEHWAGTDMDNPTEMAESMYAEVWIPLHQVKSIDIIAER